MKVSVLMLAYNHERFIAQALESILNQQVNFAYEIVIGEDCSADGTRAVLMDFYRRYPDRVVPILRDRNVGAMRNMMETMKHCHGQYLAFLEGDDYWLSVDKLQKQIDFLDSHPGCAICCHRVRLQDEERLENLGDKTEVFPLHDAGTYKLEDLLKQNFIMTCSMVLRNELIGVLPEWFLGLQLGDWPLCVLVARFGTIELLNEIMAVYRRHQGGTWSSRPQTSRIRESIRMLKALDETLAFRYSETIRRAIAPSYLELAAAARNSGNRIETLKNFAWWICHGGLSTPVGPRAFASLAAYVLIGSRYKFFSRQRAVDKKRSE
jgi:glycosyltransferase involved in cell wall biosynthesis